MAEPKRSSRWIRNRDHVQVFVSTVIGPASRREVVWRSGTRSGYCGVARFLATYAPLDASWESSSSESERSER